MFKKCILILAASCMMYSCATQTESNPFLTEFQTPNGVPPFDKIKLEHYEPAFQKGIEEQNANIQAIIANTEAPTFENVVVALDNSSPTLDRVGGVFFNLTEAETTDELTALSMKLAPTLAEHEDNISLNQELFKKIDAVYNQKDALGLTREQQRLLEKTYKGFVRSGANLPADKQARLREINKQLSTLGITFSNNILNENNDFKLYVEKRRRPRRTSPMVPRKRLGRSPCHRTRRQMAVHPAQCKPPAFPAIFSQPPAARADVQSLHQPWQQQ